MATGILKMIARMIAELIAMKIVMAAMSLIPTGGGMGPAPRTPWEALPTAARFDTVE